MRWDPKLIQEIPGLDVGARSLNIKGLDLKRTEKLSSYSPQTMSTMRLNTLHAEDQIHDFSLTKCLGDRILWVELYSHQCPLPHEDFIGVASEVGEQYVVLGSYYRVIVLIGTSDLPERKLISILKTFDFKVGCQRNPPTKQTKHKRLHWVFMSSDN